MLTICCVCDTVLKDGPAEPVSHGYCKDCMRAAMISDDVPEADIDAAIMDLNLKRWERIWK